DGRNIGGAQEVMSYAVEGIGRVLGLAGVLRLRRGAGAGREDDESQTRWVESDAELVGPDGVAFPTGRQLEQEVGARRRVVANGLERAMADEMDDMPGPFV